MVKIGPDNVREARHACVRLDRVDYLAGKDKGQIIHAVWPHWCMSVMVNKLLVNGKNRMKIIEK